jgi:hypothetical protein
VVWTRVIRHIGIRGGIDATSMRKKGIHVSLATTLLDNGKAVGMLDITARLQDPLSYLILSTGFDVRRLDDERTENCGWFQRKPTVSPSQPHRSQISHFQRTILV